MSFTPVPSETKLFPNNEGDVHVSFWGMAQLGFPEARSRHVSDRSGKIPSRVNKHTLPPDDRLLCYDFLYYVGAYDVSEFVTTFLLLIMDSDDGN